MTMHHRFARRRLWAGVGALALLATAGSPVGPALAADSIDWLDHSFGGGLQAFDLSPKTDAAAAVVVQDDGKVLVAASVSKHSSPNAIPVLRFLPDGRPDAGFGNAGRVLLANEGTPTIGMAVQDDGRILVGSNIGTGFQVFRLEATGLIDTTFSAGHVTLFIPGAGGLEYNAMALAPDGKVVVAGSFITAGNSRGLVVARIQTNGALDQNFGTGGLVIRQPPAGISNWSEKVSSVVVRPDGSVVVGGTISLGTFQTPRPVSSWFLLTQLTPAGAFDLGFGDRGTVHTDFSRGSTLRDSMLRGITLQGDGKIVAAGQAWQGNGSGNGEQAVARYLADGRLDPGFGSAGIVVSPAPPSSRATTLFYGSTTALTVAVDDKGRIVTGGEAWGAGTLDMALTRYTPTGVLDQSFGRSGWMKIERTRLSTSSRRWLSSRTPGSCSPAHSTAPCSPSGASPRRRRAPRSGRGAGTGWASWVTTRRCRGASRSLRPARPPRCPLPAAATTA